MKIIKISQLHWFIIQFTSLLPLSPEGLNNQKLKIFLKVEEWKINQIWKSTRNQLFSTESKLMITIINSNHLRNSTKIQCMQKSLLKRGRITNHQITKYITHCLKASQRQLLMRTSNLEGSSLLLQKPSPKNEFKASQQGKPDMKI